MVKTMWHSFLSPLLISHSSQMPHLSKQSKKKNLFYFFQKAIKCENEKFQVPLNSAILQHSFIVKPELFSTGWTPDFQTI